MMKKLPETWKQVKPISENHQKIEINQRKAIESEDEALKSCRTRFLGRIPVSSASNANSSNFSSSGASRQGRSACQALNFESAFTVLQKKNAAAGRIDQDKLENFSFSFNEDIVEALDVPEKGEESVPALQVEDRNPLNVSLSLSSWNLPESVVEKYVSNGAGRMFEWQRECLAQPGVLSGGNLVYSAPTSAGKTMVAEILLLKRVLERKKKAIFVLPFVSVTREKTFHMQNLLQDAGVKVGGFMGGQAPAGGFAAVDVALCTIEKANSLVNRLVEEGNLSTLGIIVVDELHMLGDPGRGYLLELLLAKVIYLQREVSSDRIQIVGMSATLPNLDLVAEWLGAALYRTDYRPIPLRECVKIGTAVFDRDMRKLRDVPESGAIPNDSEHVIQLCVETVAAGHGVLVFCPTKRWCEALAKNLSDEIRKLGEAGDDETNPEVKMVRDGLRAHLDGDSLRDVLEQLSRTPVGLDQILRRTVSFGVAFHHAGLTMDERDAVEGSFRQGVLKIIVATSTLSSGVNLPARRVIIRTPIGPGNRPLDVLVYRQMIGRAGRKGADTEGESILLCKANEVERARSLVKSELRPVSSCLAGDDRQVLSGPLKRAILEIVVSGSAKTAKQVEEYVSCTLLASSKKSEEDARSRAAAVRACVSYLEEHELVKAEDDKFNATSLGSAVLASALSPNEGLLVFEELERARRSFVLENELHVVYQVTPVYAAAQWPNVDWLRYADLWSRLNEGMRRVGAAVGIDENFLTRAAATGGARPGDPALSTHKRFYVALALHDLVNEVPLSVVADRYNCDRGTLQSLQQSASSFAGMVTVFCNRLGWVSLELLIAQFQSRLHFGVQRELMDLVRLPSLTGRYARTFYDRGLPTVVALANADPRDVEAILRNARPFESNRRREGESAGEAEVREDRCRIRFPGKKGMTEAQAARVLVSEARELVQKELGIKVQWEMEEEEKAVEDAMSRDDGTLEPNPTLSSQHVSPAALRILKRSPEDRREPFEREAKDDFPSPPKRSRETSPDIFHPDSSGFEDSNPQADVDSDVTNCSVELFTNSISVPEDASPAKEDGEMGIRIVDVTADARLFRRFLDEWNTKLGFSVSVAREPKTDTAKDGTGSNAPLTVNSETVVIVGFAVCWGDYDAYYVDMRNGKLPRREVTAGIKEFLLQSRRSQTCVAFDAKSHLKCLHELTASLPKFSLKDPKVAEWLLDPTEREKSLATLVTEFLPDDIPLLSAVPRQQGVGSVALDARSKVPGRVRASTESVVAHHLMTVLEGHLEHKGLLAPFTDVEMPVVGILAKMELDGFGFSVERAKRLRESLQRKMAALEEEAYTIAGRRFSMTSPRDVAQVLYVELSLPPDGVLVNPTVVPLRRSARSPRVPSAGPKRLPKNYSTSKDGLQKLTRIHRLPAVILEWRRISSALSKIIMPLLKIRSFDSARGMDRVHGVCLTHTATGRVSMVEPNLQNVNRDFEVAVQLPALVPASPYRTRSSRSAEADSANVSIRHAFVASRGWVLVSADYCQLELRILAHLSEDPDLSKALTDGGDAFRTMASQWKGVQYDAVTDAERQSAKHICYGMIYGIGPKALSEQLRVTENEAAVFISTFKDKYPGVRRFLERCVESCRRVGYAETVFRRRRYISAIDSVNVHRRSQAERQAVNTPIQGSAADLVKEAMVAIDRQLEDTFRGSEAAFLVLQLHDELVYEVPERDTAQVAGILKENMERAAGVSVPLPVRIRAGPSWATLRDLVP